MNVLIVFIHDLINPLSEVHVPQIYFKFKVTLSEWLYKPAAILLYGR